MTSSGADSWNAAIAPTTGAHTPSTSPTPGEPLWSRSGASDANMRKRSVLPSTSRNDHSLWAFWRASRPNRGLRPGFIQVFESSGLLSRGSHETHAEVGRDALHHGVVGAWAG